MTEKTISKHLLNLEKHFALTQPVLQKASKLFHELDQIEYELGLIDDDESTARKSSWWPIISFIGGHSAIKNQFIDRYLNINPNPPAVQISNHKFTVLQYTPQNTEITLPGTALDVDHRLPFYQISEKIEQLISGESQKINGYLELKTLHSERLKGKLFIDTPNFGADNQHPISLLFIEHTLDISDLIFVFSDVFFETDGQNLPLIAKLKKHQDTNKLIYLIDRSSASDQMNHSEIIEQWQTKLAELGLDTGEFILLPTSAESQDFTSITAIEQRLINVEYDRSYRVLHSLEKNIRDIDDVIMPAVQNALSLWKERANITTLIIMGFIIFLIIFAEVSIGILDLMLDPLIGSISAVIFIAILVTVQILVSKVYAKFIITDLIKQQKSLNLIENLAVLFEKSLTFWRIILPVTEPVGSNRKNRARLNQLMEKTKTLIQSLNDGFSHLTNDEMELRSLSDPTQQQ
ncbi:MAG: hypothetical protein RL637_799 [Pseudomonadota bacterium]